MKIGLISDTHVPDRAPGIPQTVYRAFKGVDLILHAGDITDSRVIERLEEIAPVIAVEGNMDRYNDYVNLKKSEIIEVENHKIGLIHGEVYPRGDIQQLAYKALELGVDILVSGHSHIAHAEQVKNILLINPGSPTAPRLSEPSVAIMDIEKNNVNVEFIKVGAATCSSLLFAEDRQKENK